MYAGSNSQVELEQRVLPMLMRGQAGLQEVAQCVDRLDIYTWGHSERVSQYAVALGRISGMSEIDLEQLRCAALLHDLGKALVPKQIRIKPGHYTTDEQDCMARHPADAARIIARMPRYGGIAAIVRHHHERFDGEGYPDHLRGRRIPREARLLAIADAYDAMVSNRPHRKPLDIEAALKEIESNRSRQFDPELANKFVNFIKKRWGKRVLRFGAATVFAEFSIRTYERLLVEVARFNPDMPPAGFADCLEAEFPELDRGQSEKIVLGHLMPDEVTDDLYGSDVVRVKADEAVVRFPAQIDAAAGSIVRFENRSYALMDIIHRDDGRFDYHLKR